MVAELIRNLVLASDWIPLADVREEVVRETIIFSRAAFSMSAPKVQTLTLYVSLIGNEKVKITDYLTIENREIAKLLGSVG